MFGTGRRRIMTGDHVEVWREAAAEDGRAPYFRKRFVAQRSPNAIDWNLREALLILTLDELGSAHLQQFESTSNSQDRKQRDLRTQHAGPSLQHWLDLPLKREGRRVAHAFHDCAHWFALARHGLTALCDINSAGALHLDIKPDNICIPTDVAIFEPQSGQGMRVDVARLCLIDFAFSLWESKLPLGRALGMGIFEETEYQSRQLRSAIAAGERGDLEPIRYLDWRADLYGLGWTLAFILQDLPPLGSEGAPGWNAARLGQAQGLVRQLLSFDETWRDHPDAALPAPPHQALIADVDQMLAAADLRRSLATPWHLVPDENWKLRELVTPVTVPALDLRTPDAGDLPISVPPVDLRVLQPPPRQGGSLSLLLAATAAVCAVGLVLHLSQRQSAAPAQPTATAQASVPAAKPDTTEAKREMQAPPARKPPAPAQAQPEPLPQDAPAAPAATPQAPSAPPPAADTPPPSFAELGERLARDLRNAPPARFAAVLAADSGRESPAEVQRAAADTLLERWSAAALTDRNRAANLQALLWLLKQLPEASRREVRAALGARYWTAAAMQGDRDWWRRRAGADAEGRAWLGEASLLAGAGVHQALHTLAHAYALGLGLAQNPTVAGQRLSQALTDIGSDGLHASRAWRATHAGRDANPAAADAVIVELAMKLVSWKALANADRRFATAVVPGLKHLADLGEPAAATMLGDIYACRVEPPMKREARLAYAEAQRDPAWAKVIPRRVADVVDGHACVFKLARQAKR